MLSSLDELKMICSSKYIYANLVINATCVCIYIYIYIECKNLNIQELFLGDELIQALISLDRD
jgi:hypothetical protein